MRRPLHGARTRILTSVAVLVALSTVASVAIARQILLARAGERIERTLAQEVQEFRLLVQDGRNPATGRPFGTDVRAMFDVFLSRNIPSTSEEFFTYLDGRPHRTTARPQGQHALVERMRSFATVDEVTRTTLTTSAIGATRVIAVPVDVAGRQRGVFAVTADLANEREEVDEATRVAGGVSLAVLLVASLLAWSVAGRVLAPLRDLAETARAIGETDLTRRIDVEGDEKIARLARTFNDMLDRLEAGFETQRAFVSDAGHELRTPITIIRGHLELLGDDPDERRETIAIVTDELDRMSRFVDDLLLLAKTERGEFLRTEELDLDVLTDELMTKARALAPRDWQLEHVGTGRLRGDRQRLTQAVMSLAHNAVQHTEEGDRIGLGSDVQGTMARIWVRDTGPGIPLADQERLFERFARAGDRRRRSEGAGLGLAIVRAIADAHDGTVSLDSRPGHGATFTIAVPIEGEEARA